MNGIYQSFCDIVTEYNKVFETNNPGPNPLVYGREPIRIA